MIKNLIPSLVSLDTNENSLSGSYLSKDFNFYGNLDAPNKFHYSLQIVKDISIPDEYDFRNGYYSKVADLWYYERSIFKRISIKFRFDTNKRTLECNRLYTKIPVELGAILPPGLHLSDLINVELFLNGYVVIRGCAFTLDGKTIGIIAPGFNGKTTFIQQILDKGGKYIAEDLFVLSLEDHTIYPIGPTFSNYGRTDNQLLEHKINTSDVVAHNVHLDALYLVINTTRTQLEMVYDIKDFAWLNSLFFLSNRFIRSLLFIEGQWQAVLARLQELNQIDKFVTAVSVKDFNYDLILRQWKA